MTGEYESPNIFTVEISRGGNSKELSLFSDAHKDILKNAYSQKENYMQKIQFNSNLFI